MDDTTKGFVEAVKRMRVLQKAFDSGQTALLAPAKRAEDVVDTLLDEFTDNQHARLF